MPEYFGGDYIRGTLAADAPLKLLVAATAIVNARLIPPTITATTTINFYRISPVRGGAPVLEVEWSVDCRSSVQATSENMAQRVKEVLNREHITYGGGRYYAIADILPTLPPVDETDVYNTPVSLTVRRR